MRIIKDLYDIDMNETQNSKLLNDIPEVDIVIKMGCSVVCPFLPILKNWKVDDKFW